MTAHQQACIAVCHSVSSFAKKRAALVCVGQHAAACLYGAYTWVRPKGKTHNASTPQCCSLWPPIPHAEVPYALSWYWASYWNSPRIWMHEVGLVKDWCRVLPRVWCGVQPAGLVQPAAGPRARQGPASEASGLEAGGFGAKFFFGLCCKTW